MFGLVFFFCLVDSFILQLKRLCLPRRRSEGLLSSPLSLLPSSFKVRIWSLATNQDLGLGRRARRETGEAAAETTEATHS